jgi:S-(hydroxymethyl)glutathione dehydrogenase/alcohol dehydrogenase
LKGKGDTLTVKTKAAILVALNADLEIDEIDMPDLGPGQVLVKIAHSGVCGKQVDEVLGKRADRFIPHLLGHEAAGTVEEIGPGVRKVKPGDSVVLHWMKGSGIDSETPDFGRGGSLVNAGWVTTFSEKTIVSENRVTVIDSAVPTSVAALLGCAVTTGMGIVNNNANLKPGQSIIVFGAGGIGNNVIQTAHLVNAYPIVAVDVHQGKLDGAAKFGATHAIDGSREDLDAALREIVGQGGADAAVDTVGAPAVRESAYNVTSNTGITIFAGVPRENDMLTVDSFPLHMGRRVVGSHGGNTVPDVDIPRVARLYQMGRFKIDEQISHEFPLEQVNEAIQLVRDGSADRCVLKMG